MRDNDNIVYVLRALPSDVTARVSVLMGGATRHRNRSNPLTRYDCMLNVVDCHKLLAVISIINQTQAEKKLPRLTASELVRIIVSSALSGIDINTLQ